MIHTPPLGKACKQNHVDGSPIFAHRPRRDSTRSEVIVTQLCPGSPRPRSATTTGSILATNRWLGGLSTPCSESMLELNSLIGRKERPRHDGDEAIEAKDSGNRKGSSLAERFSRWKSETEPRTSWLLLFFCIMPVNMLIGVEYITFGIYYVEYVDYFEVASATVGFIFTIRAAFISVFSIVTSSIIRKFSARSICVCGGIMYFISGVANSLAPNVYVLYLTNGVLIGMVPRDMSSLIVLAIGNNLAFMVSTVLIQKHFTTNRGFGGSCSTIGYSIGHLTGPILVTFLIQKYSWRGSALIMAGVLAHIALFGALYREPENRRGAAAGAEDDGRDPDCVGIRNRDDCEASNAKEELHSSNSRAGIRKAGDGIGQVGGRASNSDEETGENARCLPRTGQHQVDARANGRANRREDDSVGRNDQQRVPSKDGTTNGDPDRRRPENEVRSFVDDLFDCSLCRDYRLLLYCVCSMLCRYNLCVFLQHMPRKAVKLGIGKEEVALLMSVLGITVICCRILITLVADLKWINRMALYGCGVTLGGFGSYLTLVHNFAGFLAASVVHGVNIGMTNTIAFVVLVDMLGINKLPKSMAMFNVIAAFGGMTAAPVSGRIYDVTGDYDIPFLLCGTLAVIAGLVITTSVIIKRITGRDN